MTSPIARPRVIVCGTKFGQVYLQAFRRPDCEFELAGVLGTGSERSQGVADYYGVPLFTSVEDVPRDVVLACVIVRGGLLGGPGTELAMEFLNRGISVVQEHPIHRDELAQCMRAARKNRVAYTLSTFYPYLAPVRRYIGAVRELTARQPALFVEAATGFQVSFAALDILVRCLGGARPWLWEVIQSPGAEVVGALRTGLDVPFRSADGVIHGVPTTLRVHNQMDPADPDNYAHLMHRILIGTMSGSLHLTTTHGPTYWHGRPDFPKSVREAQASPHFGHQESPDEVGSSEAIGPVAAPSFATAFATVWPDGVLQVVRETLAAATGKPRPNFDQHYLGISEMWQDLSTKLGPPELVRADPISAITRDDLAAVAQAGENAAVGTGPV